MWCGRFKIKKFRCFKCGARYKCDCDPAREYRAYEEKLTDVALGVAMVKDAAQGYGDLSILITTDTDLMPAIKAPQSWRRIARSTSRAHPVGSLRTSMAGLSAAHRRVPGLE